MVLFCLSLKPVLKRNIGIPQLYRFFSYPVQRMLLLEKGALSELQLAPPLSDKWDVINSILTWVVPLFVLVGNMHFSHFDVLVLHKSHGEPSSITYLWSCTF